MAGKWRLGGNEAVVEIVRWMDDLRLGLVCRALRRRLGWRQVDLAERAGVSQDMVSRIERGLLSGIPLELYSDRCSKFGPSDLGHCEG